MNTPVQNQNQTQSVPFSAINNYLDAQGQTKSATSAVLKTVAEAVDNLKLRRAERNRPVPDESEIKLFSETLIEKINASASRLNTLRNTGNRKQRRLEIAAKALALGGVKFLHDRDYMEKLSYVDSVMSKSLLRVNFEKDTLGGATIAFKYSVDPVNNTLSMNYAVAFCRKDENFDPLIGAEEALKKFEAGILLTTEIAHDNLGPIKRQLMRRDFHRKEQEVKLQDELSNSAV